MRNNKAAAHLEATRQETLRQGAPGAVKKAGKAVTGAPGAKMGMPSWTKIGTGGGAKGPQRPQKYQ